MQYIFGIYNPESTDPDGDHDFYLARERYRFFIANKVKYFVAQGFDLYSLDVHDIDDENHFLVQEIRSGERVLCRLTTDLQGKKVVTEYEDLTAN